MMTSVPNRIDFCRQSYQSYGPIKVANEFRINDHCSSLQMLLASVLDPLSPLFMKLIYSVASICNHKIFVDVNPFLISHTANQLIFCANALALQEKNNYLIYLQNKRTYNKRWE